MSRVAVVTDSTASLPPGVAEKYDVAVVPMQVVLDGRIRAEGVDLGPADVAVALRAHRMVSTSGPTPGAFVAAFRAAASAGASAVVAVLLSAELSGTVEAARLAAGEVGELPVTVVDSRAVTMGLGFAVLSAAEAAAVGAEPAEVAAVARRSAAGTTTLFCPQTLEYLRRGGRIGAAAALLGTALAVKPLLTVTDGRIRPLDKVRTAAKAVARLAELAARAAGDGPVDVAVHHLDAPARAGALADRLRADVAGLRTLYVSEVGAAVAAHTGPGVVGVVVAPAHR